MLLPTPRVSMAHGSSSVELAANDPRRRLEAAVELLPTPAARDWRDGEPVDMPANSHLGRAAWDLLPTPRASDGEKGGPNQHGSAGDLMLPSAVNQLLPTPSAADGLGGHERRGGDRGDELLLAGAAKLLPTPTTVDAKDGRNITADRRPGGSFQPGWTLTDVAYAQRFGQYAAAVARWEPLVGRPAPEPTEQGRLSPAFVEWMMGLPDGWVTGVPGLRRAQRLKALGNGVVPQQAVAALLQLLAVSGVARTGAGRRP